MSITLARYYVEGVSYDNVCLYATVPEEIIEDIEASNIDPRCTCPTTRVIDLLIICECGNRYEYNIRTIPEQNILCECGNYIIKYEFNEYLESDYESDLTYD